MKTKKMEDMNRNEIIRTLSRSFIKRYYSEYFDFFELFWEGVKNHLESIRYDHRRTIFILEEIGFADQKDWGRIFFQSCAVFAQFVYTISSSNEPPDKSTLLRILKAAIINNKVSKPLSDQMVRHFVAFAEESLDSILGKIPISIANKGRRRVVFSNHPDKWKSDTQIDELVRSGNYDLSADEERESVRLHGKHFPCPVIGMRLLFRLLRDFKASQTTYKHLYYEGWREEKHLEENDRKKISEHLNRMIKTNDAFEESIKPVRGIGFQFILTKRIKNFLFATSERESTKST